jgi:hypothetical protein
MPEVRISLTHLIPDHALVDILPSLHSCLSCTSPSLRICRAPSHQSWLCISQKSGLGLVIARLPDSSWSASLCITMGGLGWGTPGWGRCYGFCCSGQREFREGVFHWWECDNCRNISTAVGPIGTGGAVQASLASWCGCSTSTLDSLPPLHNHLGVHVSFLAL